MSGPIEMPLVTEKLRPGTDESKSQWVIFPNQRQYLLPIVARKQKFTPRFTSEGVLLDVQQEDPEVASLIERFLDLVATVEAGEIWFKTQDAIADFFLLVRRLILTNYDMTDDEIAELLTVTGEQMSQLFETVLRVILRA